MDSVWFDARKRRKWAGVSEAGGRRQPEEYVNKSTTIVNHLATRGKTCIEICPFAGQRVGYLSRNFNFLLIKCFPGENNSLVLLTWPSLATGAADREAPGRESH